MNFQTFTLHFICCLTLFGCAHNEASHSKQTQSAIPLLEVNWQLPFDNTQPMIPIEQALTLTEAQKKAFLNDFHSEENADIPPYKRISNYLEKRLYSYSYRGQTLPVNQALEHDEGNCLSLAMVTTALAQLVGGEVGYQRVHTNPVYRRYDHIMTVSTHVRTHVYGHVEKLDDVIVVRRPKVVIDYFPVSSNDNGEHISRDDFYSMYYQNMAGDALIERNFELAYQYLNKAMALNPYNAETLNMLAVLHKKRGNKDIAASIFEYALTQQITSVNGLSNYAQLLQELGQQDKLNAVLELVGEIDDDNPYQWIDMGNRFFRSQAYQKAIQCFNKAVKEAPYLHEGYFGLAKVHFQLGDESIAIDYMKTASDLAVRPTDTQLYEAKLSVLTSSEDE